MYIRLAAIAGLAGQLGQLTFSMGEVLVRARRPREQALYYEDHF